MLPTKPLTQEPLHDPDYWTLARLRDGGYGTPVALPPQSKEFQQVRPGKVRKTYSSGPPPELLQFRPNRFRAFYFDLPSETLRPTEEIAARLDTRPLSELDELTGDSLRQMVLRARTGDAVAMRLVADRAYSLLRHVELLEKVQPQMVKEIAESRDRWPVLLAPTSAPAKPNDPKRESRRYPKELEAVLGRLHKLNVGAKAWIRASPGRAADKQSYWAQLARWAVEECYAAGALVKIYGRKAAAVGAQPQRSTTKLWNSRVEATYYYVREGTICAVLVITDWEKRCASLSTPIACENFAAWQSVIREFVREYWASAKPAYQHALNLIRQSDRPEHDRRSMALDRVKQALKTLAGN
jgi:hypothetical protein